MLFSDAVFNIFAGVFDVLNDVRQNVAVVLLFLYPIIPNLDTINRVRVLLCETSMLLFVFRITFVLIWVFRELDRYGLARVIKQLCQFFPLKENLCYSQWQRLRGNCLRTFGTTCLPRLGF